MHPKKAENKTKSVKILNNYKSPIHLATSIIFYMGYHKKGETRNTRTKIPATTTTTTTTNGNAQSTKFVGCIQVNFSEFYTDAKNKKEKFAKRKKEKNEVPISL